MSSNHLFGRHSQKKGDSIWSMRPSKIRVSNQDSRQRHALSLAQRGRPKLPWMPSFFKFDEQWLCGTRNTLKDAGNLRQARDDEQQKVQVDI